jgi:hypothetical protein
VEGQSNPLRKISPIKSNFPVYELPLERFN